MKKQIIICLITIILGFIGFYLFIPAINITNPGFWVFVVYLLILFGVLQAIAFLIDTGEKVLVYRKGKVVNNFKDIPSKGAKYSFGLVICIIVINIVLGFIISPLFMAKTYSNRITVDETGNFSEDVKEVDFNDVPLLDRDSSEKLGDRVMGKNSKYVSQYYVSSQYTQINYNDDIIRVTPLEYDDFFKWIGNRGEGINAYITVNSVNGKAKLVNTSKGMKYMQSGYFNDNLERHLRFQYPTTIFGESKFEIDNDGNPYWITPTIKYTGIGKLERVSGVVITDPITGDSKKYSLKKVPEWVDNVTYSSLVIEQIDDWGTYRDGFINSIFGQKDVVETTSGYNYLALDDDIYLYTGITSALSDESNLGFVLVNLRTGKTTYYDVAGAEEKSAMSSAEGQVQQMSYESTFPLLINLNNKPTYLVSLKDAGGLVKMYGFIDVEDYQKVVVTNASEGINKAAQNYLSSTKDEVSDDLIEKKDIIVSEITNAVVNNNTYYYIVDNDGDKYYASISLSNKLPFVRSGDTLSIAYYEKKDITEIVKIN